MPARFNQSSPLLILLLAALLACFCWLPASSPAACLTLPLMQGQDPQLAFDGTYYNLVQSDGCNVRLTRTTSLATLAFVSSTIIYPVGCANVWAPEIHFLSDHWYIYYSEDTGAAGAERVHVAQSTDTSIYGPYTEKGVLWTNYWNIDGSVFTTTNGQLYFICSGSPSGTQDICIAPMSNPYTLASAPVVISQPTLPWEVNGFPVNEGPYAIVATNGQVFIDFSASFCGTDQYCLGLLALHGTNILNPASWTKSPNPVFSMQPWGAFGTGHNGIFQDAAGQWWNIYHANDLTGQGCGGYRQLRLQRLTWTNGIPYFGTAIPTNSLVNDDTNDEICHYPLNASGGTFASMTNCGPSGVLHGTPVWKNPGLQFNGTNSYVECSAALGNDVQSTLTIAAWIKVNQFVSWASILSKGTNTEPYAMQVWGDGSLRFTVNWGNPTGGVGGGSWNSTTKMNTNEWFHVAVTYDGATVRFYINGVLDANQPAADLHFGVVNEPLILGADLPGGQEFFNGTVREVHLYGRALSSAEILNLSQFNHPPIFTSVAADQIVGAGQTLAVNHSATEPESPPQTLTFSLLSGPTGATVNPTTGLFSWRAPVASAPSTNLISIVVADSGTPSLMATQSFQVIVTNFLAPNLSGISGGATNLALTINGPSGPDYSILASTNLADPSAWQPVFFSNSPLLPFTWSAPTTGRATFYRVQPSP